MSDSRQPEARSVTDIEIVRGRSVDDCQAVRPLVEAHIKFERASTVLHADWADSLARLLAEARIALFIARVGKMPIGYATLTTDVATWTASRFAHLDCLYIDTAQRGAGLGRRLLEAAAAAARAAGATELQWQTPEWNADAIRFYERLGATSRAKARFSLSLTNTSDKSS